MATVRNRGKKTMLDQSDTSLTEDSLSLKHPNQIKRFRRCNSKKSSESSHSYTHLTLLNNSKENSNVQNGIPAYARLFQLISGTDGGDNSNRMSWKKVCGEESISTCKQNSFDAQSQRADKGQQTISSSNQQNKQLEKKIKKLCREREVQRNMRRQAEEKVTQLQMEVEELEKEKIKLLTELEASQKQKNKFFKRYKYILQQQKQTGFQTAREVSLYYQLSTLKKHVQENKSDNQVHLQQIIFKLQAYIQQYHEEGKIIQIQKHLLENQVECLEKTNFDLEKRCRRLGKQAKNMQLLMKSYKEDYHDLKKAYQNIKKSSKTFISEEQENSLNLSESSENDFQFGI